ncbi:MAG: sensor domain-containing diguanylate cyclase [Armatimonas sp.]
MNSGQRDLQAAFRSLVHGEQCYHWRSIIRFSEESGKFHWEFPEFDLATAQRFLELPATTPEEYLRQEKRHANPEDWARCRESIEQTLLRGGKGIQQEYRIRDTRGRQRITRDMLKFDRLSKGIWEVNGFCFDVTESRIRERFQAGQSQVLEMIATGRPCSEALEQLCLLLQESLGEGFTGLGRYNAATHHITGFVAPSMSERHRNILTRMRLGLPEAMKITSQFMVIEDVRKDPEWKGYQFLYRASGCPTAWTHPVRDAQGKLSGFIGVFLTTPRAPTEAELQALQAAAQIAGVALEREEIERLRADSEKTVMDVLRGVRCLLWQAQVRLMDGETYRFYDLKLPQQDIGLQFLGFGASDPADLFTRIHAEISPEDLTRMQANHITCFENGRSGYQNEFRCRDGRGRIRWLREEIRVEPVSTGHWQLVGVTTDVTAQRQAEEDVRWQALHDTLTGLPNRALLQQALEDSLSVARSGRRRCAVLFLDLDRFKQVNDRLGHGIGDRLLCEVARRLQGAIRESDMVARISGDEFIVLLSEVVDEADARQVAERVRDALRKPCQLGPHELHIGGSIGVSSTPEMARAPKFCCVMPTWRCTVPKNGATA